MSLDEILDSLYHEIKDHLYETRPPNCKATIRRLYSYRSKYYRNQIKVNTYIKFLNELHPTLMLVTKVKTTYELKPKPYEANKRTGMDATI